MFSLMTPLKTQDLIMIQQTEMKNLYLLHEDSSDPSLQSLFWSHIQANGIHSPLLLRHVKSSDEHVLVSKHNFL